jgi:hypothetical protein
MAEQPIAVHKAPGALPADVRPSEQDDDAWCPRCGWIRAEHVRQERGYGSCCMACTRRALKPMPVESHWGPCPRCRVHRVYRAAGEPQAPQCGACQGILRVRVAAA